MYKIDHYRSLVRICRLPRAALAELEVTIAELHSFDTGKETNLENLTSYDPFSECIHPQLQVLAAKYNLSEDDIQHYYTFFGAELENEIIHARPTNSVVVFYIEQEGFGLRNSWKYLPRKSIVVGIITPQDVLFDKPIFDMLIEFPSMKWDTATTLLQALMRVKAFDKRPFDLLASKN